MGPFNSPYPFNPRMERCNHCIDDREFAALDASPLEALDGDSIGLLVSNLLLTVGEVPDFKHFLPRLFEVQGADPSENGWSSEMNFSKLARAGWRGWPDPERDSVLEFLQSYWEDRLSVFPGPEQARDFVCNVAITDADQVPFAKRWWTDGGEAAALHLADFLEREKETANAFWEKEPCRTRWMDLLTGPRSLQVLERAAEKHGSGPHAALLAAARSSLAKRESP